MNDKQPIDGIHSTTSSESLEQKMPQEEPIKLPENSLRVDKIGVSGIPKSDHTMYCDPHNVPIQNPHNAAVLDPQQMMDISIMAKKLSFAREKITLQAPKINVMNTKKIDPEMAKKLVANIMAGKAFIAHLDEHQKIKIIHHLNMGNHTAHEISSTLFLPSTAIYDMEEKKRLILGASAITHEHLHNADLPVELKNKLINMKFEDEEHSPESWAQFVSTFHEALEAHYAAQAPEEEETKTKKTLTQSTEKTLDNRRFEPVSSSKEISVQKTSILSSMAFFTLGNTLISSSGRAERSRAKEQEENKTKMKDIEKREILEDEIEHTELKHSVHHHDLERVEESDEDTGIHKSPPTAA